MGHKPAPPPKIPPPSAIGNAFKDLGKKIASTANTAVSDVSKVANTAVSDVSKVANTTVSNVSNVAKTSVSDASNVAKTAVSDASNVAKTAETSVVNVANQAAPAIVNVAKQAETGVVSVANQAGSGIVNVANQAGSGIVNVANQAGSGIVNVADQAGSGIINVAKQAETGIVSVAKQAETGIVSVAKQTGAELTQFGKEAGAGLNQLGQDIKGAFEHSDGPNGKGPLVQLRYTAPPPLPTQKPIPNVITPTPLPTLKNYNYYPYTTIKTPDQMNISSSGEQGTIDKNLTSLSDYNNALYSGNTKAFVNDTNGQPFGSRYFAPAYDTCLNTDGTAIVDRYYPIDDMLYGKNDLGQINFDNKGILYSSQSTINKIGSSSQSNQSDSSTNKTCVQVTMVTNQNGSIESQYVSMDDYNNMDCSAFQNNCKKYYGMTDCEPCNTETTVPTETPFPTNFNFSSSVNNNQFIPVTYYEVLDTTITSNPPQVTNAPQIVKKENFQDIYNNDTDETDQLLNIIFISSLSLVGVYILYKILKKNKLIE